MKTAQIMKRNLNGLEVRQNHKTEMFNANDLLAIYNKENKEKRLDNYLRATSTNEYKNFLEQKAIDSNTSDVSELNQQDSVIKTSRGRVNGGTWMHPNLFIDFAMWLSVEFKDWAIECVKDRLIAFRDDAGESFKEVNQMLALRGPRRPIVYIQEAKMINELVFEGKTGQRNNATEEQLDLLSRIQKADIKLIEQGDSITERKRKLEMFKMLST